MAVAEIRGRVMASELHIVVTDSSRSSSSRFLEEALHRAARHVEHLERRWSRFIRSSDVSRINGLGPEGGTIEVDPSTLTLLARMVDGYDRTAGRCDPRMLRVLIDEGYDASRGNPSLVSPSTGSSAPVASLHDLDLDPVTRTVSIPAGLVIDPGAIGKGLAADLVVAALRDHGVAGALVDIGGDLAMSGTPVDPAGWLVDIEHPSRPESVLCSLAISGGGVATSSVRSRRWIRDGVERHHQIDARTAACSTTDLAAVTVIAPAGWIAEVHATAALSLGSDGAIAHLEGHGLSGIAVALTSEGERVWTTSDLQNIDIDLRSYAS